MQVKTLILAIAFLFVIGMCFAQNPGDFRTRASTTGNWTDATVWQVFVADSWQDTASYPTSADGTITIRTGTSLTINSDLSIDQCIVEPGASITHNAGTLSIDDGSGEHDLIMRGQYDRTSTLASIALSSGAMIYFDDGSTYIHNAINGTLPVITWHENSTLELKTIMASNQIYNSDLGNLIVSIGSGQSEFVRFSGFGFTHTIRGSVTVNSGTLNVSNAATNVTLNIGGSLYLNSGTFRIDFRSVASSNSRIKTVRVTGDCVIENGAFSFTNEPSTGISPNTSFAYLDLLGDLIINGGTISESATDLDYQTRIRMIGTGGKSKDNGSSRATQYFVKNAGTISNNVSFSISEGSVTDFGAHVLSGGTGTFALDSGCSLITAHPQGISASGAFGSIQSTGTRSFSSTASYVYNGDQAQVSGSGLPSSVMDLTIDNPNGVTLSNAVTVNGTLFLVEGDLTGTRLIDGYQDANLFIAENDDLLSGFSASSTSVDESSPYLVKRVWSISGTAASDKTITFYWSAEDDANFNWGSRVPAVFNGEIQYDGDAAGNEFNISADPRWIRVTAPVTAAKSLWHIGLKDGDDTLPVELSSFSVYPGAQNSVQITWVTQSESDCLGFHVYRGTDHDFASAQCLEQFVSATNTSQPQSYVVFDTGMDCAGTLYYWLEGLDLDGSSTIHGPISILIQNNPSGGYVDVPLVTEISALYPNPFNPMLTIEYAIMIPGPVTLKIYNTRGQIIKEFPAALLERGSFKQVWDGNDSSGKAVGSGIYLVVMQNLEGRFVRKAMLLK